MSATYTSYYNLVRVRELGPEAKDWATTDQNFEVLSLILKSFEQHSHTGIAGLTTPVFGSTTVTSGSNSVDVSTFTGTGVLNVVSTASLTSSGLIRVNTSAGTATITYTGTTGTTFTGCATTSGSGILSTGGSVVGIQPVLTETSSGGSLSPGTLVGARLSYTNSMGLETDASTEIDLTLDVAVGEPLTPILDTVDPFTGGLPGGTYIYLLTKTLGSGETEGSDVLPVTIDYDQAYSVTFTFDALNTYTDGTTGLNIYRSAGLNTQFQLVGQITDVTQTSFTDQNVSIDQTAQPPPTSTFDRTKLVTIDWSTIGAYPSDAAALNVYVTQQSGVWGTESLLTSVDLTQVSPPTSVDYLGSETLSSGYPLDSSEIPSQPPKVDLGTMATGGFILTADGDFQKHQAKNIVIDNTSTAPSSPANGQVYYDTSLHNIRAYINGSWTNWGITAGSAYTHPSEETGGHLATNIRWVTGSSSPSLNTLMSKFFDAAGNRKQVVNIIQKNGPGSPVTTGSTTPVIIDNIVIGSPEFNNQWYRVTWQGNLAATCVINNHVVLEMGIHGGSVISGSNRNYEPVVYSTTVFKAFHISVLVQVPTAGLTVDMLAFVTTGGCTAQFNTNGYYIDAVSLP